MRLCRLLLLCLLIGWGFGGAERAAAAAGACGATVAAASETLDLQGVRGWECPARFDVDPGAAQVLRFDLAAIPDRTAIRYAISRQADFESIAFVVEDAGGATGAATHSFADGRQALIDRQFSYRLPAIGPDARYLYVIMRGAKETMPLDYMRIERDLPGSSNGERNLLLLFALVIGLLIMPLMIDAGVFMVLRDRFSLFHAGMVLATIVHLTTVSGLNITLFTLDLPSIRFAAVASFGIIIVAANLFVASFIERDCLPESLRRCFYWQAGIAAFATALHAPQLPALGRYPADIFYIGCLAGVPVFVASVALAWRRGSRAVRFLVLGFAPLIVVGVIRTGSHLIPGMPTHDASGLFLAGVVVEVVATTFGVADRFLTLRRDRDRALSEASAMERRALSDPLTGLGNRRALVPAFEGLVREGYRCCALLDLDRFKSINDSFGHVTGDEVLVAAAQALAPDANVRAYRLGGEEFFLLMRGTRCDQLAEHRRQAITMRVASAELGIDRPVTASMGFLDFAAAGEDVDFETIYSRVDQLLYQAKHEGRNRTCARTLDPDQSDRETGAAVAA